MNEIFRQYLTETWSEDGQLQSFELHCPKNFNFVYDCIDQLAAKDPTRRAMLWCDKHGERRSFTFADLSEASRRSAAFFRSLGVKKGDRVLLILKRHYEFWTAVLGLMRIGAIAVPAPAQLKAFDLIYRLKKAQISVAVVTQEGEIAAELEQAEKEGAYPLRHKLAVHGMREGWLDYNQGLDEHEALPDDPPAERPIASDPMMIYFTSGTTGLAKMVLLDHAYPIAHIVTARYWQRVNPDGLHLTVSESGWAKSLWGKLYGQWLLGASIYVYDFDRFDAADLLQHIADDRITTFCAPPTIYRFLIHEDMSQYDLSALEHCTVAGEALNPEVFETWKQATGLEMKEGFGQTETTLSVATFYWMEAKPGSMGKPNPLYDVRILTEEGREAQAGEVGEICLKTKAEPGSPENFGMFRGYLDDPELTAEFWHDGYYRTHDLVSVDEEGYLWYQGRSDDMIKSSGYKISPFEVENVLMEHPAVLECAVTASPDPIRGQVIVATIVLLPNYEASDALAKEIQDFVKQTTAPYKYPRRINFVDTLPKTHSGKIRRRAIREAEKL